MVERHLAGDSADWLGSTASKACLRTGDPGAAKGILPLTARQALMTRGFPLWSAGSTKRCLLMSCRNTISLSSTLTAICIQARERFWHGWNRIGPGTIVYFDELPDHDHELRAFFESQAANDHSVTPLAVANGGQHWLLRYK